MVNYCFLSSIVEILLYYCNQSELNSTYSTCLFFFEIANGILISRLEVSYFCYSCFKAFKVKIFDEKNVMNPNEILYYMELIQQYRDNLLTFNDFLRIFSDHKNNCIIEYCPCKSIALSSWLGKAKQENPENPENPEKVILLDSFDDFIIVGENEIAKSLNNYYKNKNKSLLETFLILQIEFLFKYKNEKKLALYFTHQYFHHHYSNKFSYTTKMLLFEYQKMIYKVLTKLKVNEEKIKLGDTPLEISLRHVDSVSKSNKFFLYTNIIQKLMFLLRECCEIEYKIFDFRRNIWIKTNNTNIYYKNSENFIKLCNKLQKRNNLLINTLFSLKTKLHYFEVFYLLTHYFNLNYKKIPKKIENKITPVFLIMFSNTKNF